MLTMSRQAGSGGDEIVRLVTKELGWKVLDNSLAEKLLVEKGFPQAVVESYSDRKPDLWHRLSAGKERYLHYLQLVSYEFARQGDCIIQGRGGQLIFADVPGVLKVRVVAPLEDRVRNLAKDSGQSLQRAMQLVQHSDGERSGFHRFLFHADWDSALLYDLVINCHLFAPRAAAEMILKTLSWRELQEKKEASRRRLGELYLVQKAYAAILYEQKLPIHYLEIEVHNGTVTLKGVARDHPSIERCRETAAAVFVRKRIDNEIGFEPKYVEMFSGMHYGEGGGKAG